MLPEVRYSAKPVPTVQKLIDGKLDEQDLLATLCQALGVNPATENIAEGGRPIAIAEGNVVKEVLA